MGLGCMALCLAAFSVVAGLLEEVRIGLVLLLVVWFFSCGAAVAARNHVIAQEHVEHGPPQHLGEIRLMVALAAASSGVWWSLLISGIVTVGILHCSVTLSLDAWTLGVYVIVPNVAGVYVGKRLTQRPRLEHPFGAGEPLLLEGAAVTRMVWRYQVQRAVHVQVQRSLGRQLRAVICGTVALILCLVALCCLTKSSEAFWATLWCWQIFLISASRGLFRRLLVHRYSQMFPLEV